MTITTADLTTAGERADLLSLAGVRVPRAIEARLEEPVADLAAGLAAD